MAAPVTNAVFFGNIAFELFDREPGHEFLIRRLFLFVTSGPRIPAHNNPGRRIFLGWILLGFRFVERVCRSLFAGGAKKFALELEDGLIKIGNCLVELRDLFFQMRDLLILLPDEFIFLLILLFKGPDQLLKERDHFIILSGHCYIPALISL